MKVTYYVATSLDGYIAKEDGDVGWLEDLGISMEETGYEEFFSTVDALVMGRNTYEFINNYGSWPYGDKPTWVCTSRKMDVIDGCNLQDGTTIEDLRKEAEGLGIKHLWLVGGGKPAGSLIENEILTHLSISQMPIILGGGITIFGNLKEPIKVKRQSILPHNSGFFSIRVRGGIRITRLINDVMCKRKGEPLDGVEFFNQFNPCLMNYNNSSSLI